MIEHPEIRITGRGTVGIRFSFQRDPIQSVTIKPICILIIKAISRHNCIVIDSNGDKSHKRSRL